MHDRPTRPPGHDTLMNTVLDLVARTADTKRDRITPDMNLFSSADRFDSFALLELVIRLEGAFGLNISDEDLDPEAFSSPRAIASYLLERLPTETPHGN